MENLNILVEAKKEYIEQLCIIFCPQMIEVFESMYNQAREMSKGKKVLITFQDLLKEVPHWNDAMCKEHSDNLCNRCVWFNDLVAAVFVCSVKILSSVRLNKGAKKLSLKLPSNEVFIHMCYRNVAENLYNDPYIYHESMNEYDRNDKLFERYSSCVQKTIKELIPVQEILKTYMIQENMKSLDVDDITEDPEIEDEPVQDEPVQDEPVQESALLQDVPSEGLTELAPPESTETPTIPLETSHLDTEFKNINLNNNAPPQPQPQLLEEDGDLFPDAPEERRRITS